MFAKTENTLWEKEVSQREKEIKVGGGEANSLERVNGQNTKDMKI